MSVTAAVLLYSLALSSQQQTAQAKWFGVIGEDSVKDTTNWEAGKLTQWLSDHGIAAPVGFSKENLVALVQSNWEAAKNAAGLKPKVDDTWMNNVKRGAFETWTESQLRSFLLDRGIVSPNGKREELEILAKEQYSKLSASATSLNNLLYGSMTSAASVASASASSAASVASASAASAASVAGNSAYSAAAVAGNSAYSAAAVAGDSANSAYHAATTNIAENAQWAYNAAADSIASNAQWAKNYVMSQMNDASDYVWSTWSDNEMRSYLEKKGIIKTKSQLKRDELIAKLKESYNSATDPVYNAWSDSYLKAWLVKENLIKSDAAVSRDHLLATLKDNYYSNKDYVYSEWSDSALKAWLVEHNVIKSNAQLKRDEYLDLFAHHYASSVDAVAGNWHESDMREFLIKKGLLKSDRKAKKDEMIKLIKEKGEIVSDQVSEYVYWSDRRLKAYLRSAGIAAADLPVKREELLSLTKRKWEENGKRVESMLNQLKHHFSSGVGFAEEKLMHILGVAGVNVANVVKSGAEYVGDAASSASNYAATQSAHIDL